MFLNNIIIKEIFINNLGPYKQVLKTKKEVIKMKRIVSEDVTMVKTNNYMPVNVNNQGGDIGNESTEQAPINNDTP